MEEIDRSTQRDKIIGLLKTTSEISQEIDYNFDLDHKDSFYGIAISSSKINIYQNISLGLSLAICILMFFWVHVIYYPED